MNFSTWAFIFGAWGALSKIVMFSLVKAASNAWGYRLSRSEQQYFREQLRLQAAERFVRGETNTVIAEDLVCRPTERLGCDPRIIFTGRIPSMRRAI
ncbi:hypothetical protein [Streptomyces sp. NPDC046805]|uniref:hypothetical protein n=1 Tax=Streptomyces sp. NPDC046805 TaxID=3155134 RepID=UPI0033C35BD4